MHARSATDAVHLRAESAIRGEPNTARIYPFQVLLPARQTGLPHDSKADAEQARSVAVERIDRPVGQLPAALITELDQALRVHLSP